MNNKDIGTRAIPVASNDPCYLQAADWFKLQHGATGRRLTLGLLVALSWLPLATAVAQSITASPGFIVTSDWGAGANASLFITNNSALKHLAGYTASFQAVGDPATHLVDLTITFVPGRPIR